MTPIWHITTNRPLIAALVAACTLLWPAIAPAAAPPGTYTYNGHTFDTQAADLVVPVTGGTAYVYRTGMTFNWSDAWGKFTSSTNDQRWWAYEGTATSDAREFDACGYVQHRRGEFQLDDDGFYRWNCRAAAVVSRYIIRYKRAPRGMRCLKRGYTFWCSRFANGRQTVKLVYRPPVLQRVRYEVQSGRVDECGAVSTTNGASGAPGKYVVFGRNPADCGAAMGDRDAIMRMAAYTAVRGAPGGGYERIGGGMTCSKIAGTDSMLRCTNGDRCVVMSRFSKGRFPRVYDAWAWSAIATFPGYPFSGC